MGVQSETAVSRGELKRPRVAAASVAAFALLVYLYGPWPSPRVAPPSAGDCVELWFFTNGFHSDIGAPASLFPEDHPLRQLYPDATAFLIGWGDERFYRSDVFDVGLAIDAMIPPSPSVMHVAYNAPYAAAYLGPSESTTVAVSREGAAQFVAYVDRTLALDPDGTVHRIAPGKIVGRSAFVRARGSFHLFNVCNQWMARALRAAGLDLNSRSAWFGDGLLKQIQRTGRDRCPANPTPS
jgi:uncharacterized protein (TIGR02117 family)